MTIRKNAVVLARQGLGSGEIARRLGANHSYVCHVLAMARDAGVTVSSPYAHGRHRQQRLIVAPGTFDQLEEPARRRGVTARELAALLVETVAREGLADAILDDGDAHDL